MIDKLKLIEHLKREIEHGCVPAKYGKEHVLDSILHGDFDIKICKWKFFHSKDDHGYIYNYISGCGKKIVPPLIESGKYIYCPYCGNEIEGIEDE